MFAIDNSTSSSTLPTPATAGTPAYFTDGNPGTGSPATVVEADWLNMIQQELLNVLAAASVAPSKTTYNQVITSINDLIAAAISGGTSGLLHSANNLSDVANSATAATNIGLGTGNSPTFSSVVTASGYLMNFTGEVRSGDSGGTPRNLLQVISGNNIKLGDSGLTGAIQAQQPMSWGSNAGTTQTNLGVLGCPGQVWAVVTGSRALGTVYTNSTGRPIFVSVSFTSSSGSDGIQVQLNGGAFAQIGCSTASYSVANAWFIVPAGATYELITTAGSPNLTYWSELR